MQPPGVDRSFESRLMQESGVVRPIDVTSYSFLTAPYLVVGTQLIATVHSRLARVVQRGMRLTILPLPMPMPMPMASMTQTMQWHKYRTQDPALIWLRGLLHRAVARTDSAAGIDAVNRANR